ncbi:MAG: hypothetical protein U1A27_00935 [Phycisphaerae bacterium]
MSEPLVHVSVGVTDTSAAPAAGETLLIGPGAGAVTNTHTGPGVSRPESSRESIRQYCDDPAAQRAENEGTCTLPW